MSDTTINLNKQKVKFKGRNIKNENIFDIRMPFSGVIHMSSIATMSLMLRVACNA